MAAQIAFLEYLPSLAIAMARLYPCFFLIPAFCFEHVRGMPRHVIVFALALIPAPGIYHALSGVNYTLLALGGLMLKEAMLGFLLGMLLSMPFWLFESVGALLDNQRGALIGGQLKPTSGEVKINGQVVHQLDADGLYGLRRLHRRTQGRESSHVHHQGGH